MFQIRDIDNSRYLNPNTFLENAQILGMEDKKSLKTAFYFYYSFSGFAK